MEKSPFQAGTPAIQDNPRLRTPQKEAYAALEAFARDPGEGEREVGVVLPVGCGKSGCITLAPFAFRSKRSLVVAPNVKIAEQLHDDFDPACPQMFYSKCRVLQGHSYPDLVKIRGKDANQTDLEVAHIVVTNIQQLQGEENRWIENLPSDFFRSHSGHHEE